MSASIELVTTRAVMAALEKRYAPPAFAFFPEVRDHTGFARTTPHTADALVMGLWPSRGLELAGFEVKVSRADWLRELKAPAKAEAICRFCDRWWVVAADSSIVNAGELPPTWGLLVLRSGRLQVVTEAPKLEPQPLDRPFLAALMRRIHDLSVPETHLKEAERQGFAQGRKKEQERGDGWRQEAEDLRRMVKEFERDSGVQIDRWTYGHIGKAVRAVLGGATERTLHQLEGTRRTLERLMAEVDREVEVLSQVDAPARDRTETPS